MKHSQVSATPFRKSTPSEEREVDGVVDEVDAETTVAAVAEEEVVKINSSRVQAPLQLPLLLAAKGQNTQIFRQESGKDALCIINSGSKVTFVLSQQHAHGKTCSPQDRTSETGTSPLTTV